MIYVYLKRKFCYFRFSVHAPRLANSVLKKIVLYDSISMRRPCDIQELILASFISDTVSKWSQFQILTVFLASKINMYMSEINFT